MSSRIAVRPSVSKPWHSTLMTAACLAAIGTNLPVYGASDSWLSTKTDGTTAWGTASNWTGGNVPGDSSWSGTPTTADAATFGGTGNSKTVIVDPNRSIGSLTFTATGYTLSGGINNEALHFSTSSGKKITTQGAGTVATITAPVKFYSTGFTDYLAHTGTTLNFNGTVEGAGASTTTLNLVNAGGEINFNAPVVGNTNFRFNGGTAVINFNAANTFAGSLGLEQTRVTVILGAEDALQSGSANISRGGHIEITAVNGLSGTASLNVTGNLYGSNDIAPPHFAGSAIIHTANDYTGNTAVGNIYNFATGDPLSTLLVKNTDGSATGSGDVTVRGLLAGTGQIINSGAGKGVTLTEGSFNYNGNSYTTYGQLSPGDTPGEVGTLRMSLGDKGLDISSSVADAATASLLFDLDSIANSDQILLTAGVLNIGAGLEFDDFVFSASGELAAGDYTLFDTNAPITGTLGANLNGTIGAQSATLGLGDNGQDIILTVVPEPASIALLAIGGTLMLARRRAGSRD